MTYRIFSRNLRPISQTIYILAALPGTYGALSPPAWWGAGLVGVLEYL